MRRGTAAFLSTAEAAREIGVGEGVIGRLARLGRLKLPRFGRYDMVPADDLLEIRQVLPEEGYLDREDQRRAGCRQMAADGGRRQQTAGGSPNARS
jgi:hypothetical protein